MATSFSVSLLLICGVLIGSTSQTYVRLSRSDPRSVISSFTRNWRTQMSKTYPVKRIANNDYYPYEVYGPTIYTNVLYKQSTYLSQPFQKKKDTFWKRGIWKIGEVAILVKTAQGIRKRWLSVKIQQPYHGDIGEQVHHHIGKKEEYKKMLFYYRKFKNLEMFHTATTAANISQS